MEASSLYTICEQLCADGPSEKGRSQMREVLTLCCSYGTREERGRFGNLFSQIDYLAKRHCLSTSDRLALQLLRLHTSGKALSSYSNNSVVVDDTADSRTSDWRYDIRSLALLISVVFSEGIPSSLLKLLPHTNRPQSAPTSPNRRYIRCIVDTWDDTLVHATTDGGIITFDYGTITEGRDLSYIGKILREGLQLNLLDCRTHASETLFPTLIVVEPDFLLDVSSLAVCFTAYGHHPLLYTINRLMLRSDSQATLLGNFAGTALDTIINKMEGSKDDPNNPLFKHDLLATSLRRSFREQALRFCACEDFDSERFKCDAIDQINNIIEAISILRSEGNKNFLLEPSFICEKLGLQGRVDLMTADMRLLVEQKSGRNMKIARQSHDPHGVQLESHYVQLLLYYGILRYNFGRTDQSVDTRLLYSRYPAKDGLVIVNYYRSLFREAIRLRNQIVATELLITREGFGKIIPLLTPDILYKGIARDGFFYEYVLPEINTLVATIHQLSPLERAYFEQMATFVYREQVCQKLGSPSLRLHHSGGAASDLWMMSAEEKEASGNIFINLTIAECKRSADTGTYDLITLSIDKTSKNAPNFRAGDMVYLYSYKDTPDVRESILYKGALESILPQQIVVRLTDGQHNVSVFSNNCNRHWALEHGGSDQSSSSAIRGLWTFVNADEYRRQLLLGQRPPEADTTRQLSRSYNPTYDEVISRVIQSKDYFLLIGPPGTGKTSMALRFIVEEELYGNGCNVPNSMEGYTRKAVLLTAYTNRAVDEICDMLETAGHDYLRIGNITSCHPRFRHRLIEDNIAEDTTLDDIKNLIEQTSIVVATTSILQVRPYILQLKHFSRCVVDEASQILEPSIIGILSSPHIDSFVLVGDHKQLPAVVVQSEEDARVGNPLLVNIGLTDCRQSLFERLYRWERQRGRKQFIGLLDHQGRMHPEVGQFACSHFYHDEKLQPVPLPHQLEESLPYKAANEDKLDELLTHERVLFFDTDKCIEPTFVATIVHRIYSYCIDNFDVMKTIGVITPYRSQIALIREELSHYDIPELMDISIDTVERYQGSQRDVIIYSFAVEHAYQLDFLAANVFVENGYTIDRKLNVAMTRARRQLIMVGRASILKQNNLFMEIITKYNVPKLFP